MIDSGTRIAPERVLGANPSKVPMAHPVSRCQSGPVTAGG